MGWQQGTWNHSEECVLVYQRFLLFLLAASHKASPGLLEQTVDTLPGALALVRDADSSPISLELCQRHGLVPSFKERDWLSLLICIFHWK